MHLFDQTHLLTLIFYLTAVRSTGTYPSNINSQHVVVYYVIFSDFLLMPLFLTMTIFPKCTNIGAVFLLTVCEHSFFKFKGLCHLAIDY